MHGQCDLRSMSLTVSRKPESSTRSWINVSGLIALICGILVIRCFLPQDMPQSVSGIPVRDQAYLVWGIMLAVAIPIVALERWCLGDRLGPVRTKCRVERLLRCSYKAAGLAVSVGTFFLSYSVFPYFWDTQAVLVREVLIVGSPLVLLVPFYVYYVDGRMDDPKDGYYVLGAAICGKWHEIDAKILRQHGLAWMVKIFFVHYITYPLAALGYWAITNDHLREMQTGVIGTVDVIISTMFLIDIAFACVGYYWTLRMFNSHVRSTDETLFGWAVCIICYGTVWSQFFYKYFFSYGDGYLWGHWLAGNSTLQLLWATPIICCIGVYAASSVQFGIRFSNLSHRGIVTNGPYRLMKHPAYVSKNIFWWLIEVPFIHKDGIVAEMRTCVLLMFVNALYYVRARTEERHLSQDPVYREYVQWIAVNGLAAKMRSQMARA